MGKLKFNGKLDSIKPYEVDRNKYLVRLDANESFIPFSVELKSELADTITKLNFNRYPDAESDELCQLYADYCGVERKNVLAGNGSDELIQILMNALLGKDDKILTPKPDFSMYKFYTSIMEGRVVEAELDENLKLDIDKFIRKANEEKVKVVVFSNPCNPTGGIIPREDIIRIIEGCEALVLVDEAYYEFYGESLIDSIDKYENLAVLRTTSKAMGLAGVRLGFLIANENLIYNVKKVKPPFNLNIITQAVGAVALRNLEIARENVNAIISERAFLVDKLKEVEAQAREGLFIVYPTRANFVYVKSSDAEGIYKSLLKEGISIRYFAHGALRITVGNRKENEIVVEGLKKVLEV